MLFVPHALAVHDAYAAYARRVLAPRRVDSLHEQEDPVAAVDEAQAVFVGGGNTFRLLDQLQRLRVLLPLRRRVLRDGVPYLGSSAGSNLACPTIGTTNDMPIVNPRRGLEALAIVPFQINTHFFAGRPCFADDEAPDDHECSGSSVSRCTTARRARTGRSRGQPERSGGRAPPDVALLVRDDQDGGGRSRLHAGSVRRSSRRPCPPDDGTGQPRRRADHLLKDRVQRVCIGVLGLEPSIGVEIGLADHAPNLPNPPMQPPEPWPEPNCALATLACAPLLRPGLLRLAAAPGLLRSGLRPALQSDPKLAQHPDRALACAPGLRLACACLQSDPKLVRHPELRSGLQPGPQSEPADTLTCALPALCHTTPRPVRHAAQHCPRAHLFGVDSRKNRDPETRR